MARRRRAEASHSRRAHGARAQHARIGLPRRSLQRLRTDLRFLRAGPLCRRGASSAVVAGGQRGAAQPHVRRQRCAGRCLAALTLASGAAPRPADGAFSSRDWRCVCEYIEAHIHEEIVLVDLANAGGWSVRHFSRMFRRSAGQSPHRFILRKRVDRAKNLLRSPRLPLAEIALSCGFADQSHFTTSFRKATGRTPLRWRHDFA